MNDLTDNMIKYSCGASGGAAPAEQLNRPRTPVEVFGGSQAGGGPDQLAIGASRPGFCRSKGKNVPKWTPAAIAAEQEAILDRAQAERRNITHEEEQEYLKLERLRRLAEEFMEGYQDDEGTA